MLIVFYYCWTLLCAFSAKRTGHGVTHWKLYQNWGHDPGCFESFLGLFVYFSFLVSSLWLDQPCFCFSLLQSFLSYLGLIMFLISSYLLVLESFLFLLPVCVSCAISSLFPSHLESISNQPSAPCPIINLLRSIYISLSVTPYWFFPLFFFLCFPAGQWSLDLFVSFFCFFVLPRLPVRPCFLFLH